MTAAAAEPVRLAESSRVVDATRSVHADSMSETVVSNMTRIGADFIVFLLSESQIESLLDAVPSFEEAWREREARSLQTRA